jgi:glutamate/tyrosine decarboxylase-like PLP-dependent enzyme
MTDSRPLTARALEGVSAWEATWGPFDAHPAGAVDAARFEAALAEYTARLGGNYPFFHPRYAGQMLKPPHPVALAAYAAAQRINPNNHALDGGPPTGEMEKEVVALLAGMFGLPPDSLGHLTGGGTMANLEALFVARSLHPDRAVAFGADAHYTHARMCHVLGVQTRVVPSDGTGRLDLNAVEEACASGDIGTLVVTPGTTGLGTVDPIEDILPLARRHGVRIHADAAYGGFFTLLANTEDVPSGFPARHFRALAEVDSIVVDPHKHGLQPYGCGCVLFRDASVGRFYRHDSPYTYFTSDDLHLGEISLECSRPGAAAGALWLTLRVLPLAAEEGIGPILAASLRASRAWADRIQQSPRLALVCEPELDIVTFAPHTRRRSIAAVDAASRGIFREGMEDPDDPVFLSLYRLPADRLRAAQPDLEADAAEAAVLRSVLMKPEHELYVDHLHARVEALAERHHDA